MQARLREIEALLFFLYKKNEKIKEDIAKYRHYIDSNSLNATEKKEVTQEINEISEDMKILRKEIQVLISIMQKESEK